MADTSNRGLGSDNMDEQTKRDIQSKGGQASPQNFANNPDFASQQGQKGGRASGGGNSGGNRGSQGQSGGSSGGQE